MVNNHSGKARDPIQSAIGDLGRWQIFVCCVIFLLKFPVAWHQLGTIFLAPTLDFRCSDPQLSKCNPKCPKHVFNTTIFTKTLQMVSFKFFDAIDEVHDAFGRCQNLSFLLNFLI